MGCYIVINWTSDRIESDYFRVTLDDVINHFHTRHDIINDIIYEINYVGWAGSCMNNGASLKISLQCQLWL